MKFVKMHGCGNDYVYLDAFRDEGVAARVGGEGWVDLVRRMSDRHTGIGSDGVIAVCRPSSEAAVGGAAVRMRMFNADGSESEMCGNGVRCVAKFAHDRLGVRANPMLVETGRGVLSIAYELDNGVVTRATVDMGEPITDTERIPVTAPGHRTLVGAERSLILEETVDWMLELHQIDENPLDQLGKTFSCVSMGNPHLVLWGEVEMEDPEDQLIGAVGPWLEDHPMFPQRTNVHIVQPLEPGRARMLTWERGSGITQACGTGACAAVVAGVLEQRLDRHTTVQVLGGELEIRWDEATDHVFMTGEAVDVFEGEWTDR